MAATARAVRGMTGARQEPGASSLLPRGRPGGPSQLHILPPCGGGRETEAGPGLSRGVGVRPMTVMAVLL